MGCVCSLLWGCSLMSGSYNQALGQRAKCGAFGKWVHQFDEKFPGARHSPEKVAVLYTDELFVPVFGTPFDQLTEEQQRDLANSLPKCFDLQFYEGALYAINYYRDFVSPMMTNPPGSSQEISRQEILSELRRGQQHKGWVAGAMKEASQLPATTEGYARIEELWAKGEKATADMTAGERKVFQDALYADMRRIALGTVIPRINADVAGATNYEGLAKLQATVDVNRALLHIIPSDIRDQEERRIKQTLSEGVNRLAIQEWAKLDHRGKGPAAVKFEVEWYQDFQRRYLQVFQEDVFQIDWASRFDSLRRKDLREAESTMNDLVTSAKSLGARQTLVTQYLLEEEADGKVQRTDAPWAQQLRTVHAFKAKTWRYSAQEVSFMATPGGVVVPAQYGAPSGEDIRLALLRAFEANGMPLLDAYQVRIQTLDLPSLPGVGVPLGRLRLGGDAKIQECVAEPVGFTCLYTVSISLENAVVSQHETAEFVDEFALTTAGWHSPSAINRIAEQQARMTNRVFNDIASVVPKPGCWGKQRLYNSACR